MEGVDPRGYASVVAGPLKSTQGWEHGGLDRLRPLRVQPVDYQAAVVLEGG